jgi:hypothetical protein
LIANCQARAAIKFPASGTLSGFARYVFMPSHAEENRVRAERQFKAREQQKADAPKAWADYQAAQQKIRDRTRELRELRLARTTK